MYSTLYKKTCAPIFQSLSPFCETYLLTMRSALIEPQNQFVPEFLLYWRFPPASSFAHVGAHV